jgi:ADP-ribose pyrophosphatase YjhB (NUDIX family)
MLRFDVEGVRFSCRVAGVALYQNHVLFQRDEDEEARLWFLPGGRGELLESSNETLLREMYEELGVRVYIERLLWIAENFFVYRGRAGHELAFIFLMSLPPEPSLHTLDKVFVRHDERQHKLLFEWVPLDQLADKVIYPSFLKQTLLSLPTYTEHIIHTDAESAAALAAMHRAREEAL